MKYKIISDLHTEFYSSENDSKFIRIIEHYMPVNEDDKDTTLLIAGDCGTYRHWQATYGRALKYFGKRFHKVVCVPGNHSYYHFDSFGMESEFFKDKVFPKNVFYLDDSYIKIGDTLIIGSCLWSDFDKENPTIMRRAGGAMNDYQIIKTPSSSPYAFRGLKAIEPQDTLNAHKTAKQYILNVLETIPAKDIIIVTHHAPSYQSVDTRYRDDSLNGAYCSDLSDICIDYNIKLWCHGHMHCTNDYMIGNTRVICNALGYHNYEISTMFDPNKIVEI